MKKNISNIIYILVLIIMTIEVLIKSNLVINSVKFSFNMWINNIFPSLFPFFIIGNILIELNFPQILGELLKKIICKLFKINSNASFILILSMLSGFPSSAKYTKDLLDKNIIDEKDATKILTFTHFSNPLFILGTVSTFLHSKKLAILVLISHYLGNFIIGIILRNYNKKEIKNTKINLNNIKLQKVNIGNIISNSIKSTINTLLLILGSTTVFLIITTIINSIIPLNGILKPIINGIFEMTQGLKYLENLNINSNIKALISTGILSFGGLSVHMQIITIISETKIKYLPYFISRILHAFISIVILCLLIIL